MTRGGKRRRHVPPALGPADVLEARKLRASGMRYKQLMRLWPVSRDTLCCAIHGKGAYAGYPWPHDLEEEHASIEGIAQRCAAAIRG